MNSRCWPRTVNVSPRTSRNAHPPFLQAFEGTPGRLPPGGLFYARKKVVLLVFGAPYPRRGAMVVPSGIAQAFPGRSHLAIHGQIGPSRHHHCPAYWAAEPPRVRATAWTFLRSGVCGGESPKERRDRVGPSRTVFGQGWPNAEPTDTVLPINWFGPLSSRRWCGPASHNTTGRNTDRFSVLHT